MKKIFIRDWDLPCHIGAYDNEKGAPQNLRIHLKADIKDALLKDHIHMVETAAQVIVDICFKRERIKSVWVRLEKTKIFEDAVVGFEMTRARLSSV